MAGGTIGHEAATAESSAGLPGRQRQGLEEFRGHCHQWMRPDPGFSVRMGRAGSWSSL